MRSPFFTLDLTSLHDYWPIPTLAHILAHAVRFGKISPELTLMCEFSRPQLVLLNKWSPYDPFKQFKTNL